jgi:hypothetical protein
MTKNAEWADIDEKTFGFLKVTRTSFPNDTHSFNLRLAGRDDGPCLSIAAKPRELIAELTRIVKWVGGEAGD